MYICIRITCTYMKFKRTYSDGIKYLKRLFSTVLQNPPGVEYAQYGVTYHLCLFHTITVSNK